MFRQIIPPLEGGGGGFRRIILPLEFTHPYPSQEGIFRPSQEGIFRPSQEGIFSEGGIRASDQEHRLKTAIGAGHDWFRRIDQLAMPSLHVHFCVRDPDAFAIDDRPPDGHEMGQDEMLLPGLFPGRDRNLPGGLPVTFLLKRQRIFPIHEIAGFIQPIAARVQAHGGLRRAACLAQAHFDAWQTFP